jgi:glycosyltransferase involved in cell wall biosynthesis
MRIARIRHLFYPDIPRDYFYELSTRQAKAGHEVDLITWRKNVDCSKEKISSLFRVHRLCGMNLTPCGLIEDYPFLPNLPSELEILKPDIVHAESHLFLPTIQALRRAKKLRIPCVVTVHGVFAERGFFANSAQQFYLHTIGLSALRSANKIICLTQADKADIEELGCRPDKIAVVRNAVDTVFFEPCGSRSDKLVVWVGRFVKEKGVEYLVEAARDISKNASDVKILLIGYGPLKEKIVEMSRNYGLLGKSIFIEGPLSREEVAQTLRKATIFAFPSLREGMPIALLEAMASELPVVVFDVPGIRELVKHGMNGLVVEPKNHEQLSKAILYLLNNEDQRKAFGEKSRRKVIENNSWKKVLAALDMVYFEAISEVK